MSALFQQGKLGSLVAKNRIFMAPLTRCRATEGGHVPTDLMTEYYAQRASAGLVIAEATMVQDKNSSFWTEPGVYSDEQVAAWKKVTDAVHAKGGLIVLQIWHGGRTAAPENNDGNVPVAPSAIKIEAHGVDAAHNPSGEKIPYSMPKEIPTEEVPAYVALFVKAAQNAMAAGFDGVEVHAANGYLIDQFLRSSSNKRTDKYGGSQENRMRFLLEIVDGVSAAIGSDKVGVRLSPLNSYNGMQDEDPVGLTKAVSAALSARNIAYLHMMRADFFQAQTGDVLGAARENFKGFLVSNMGYEPAEAEQAVAEGKIDAVAFGTKFISNPDLPERIKAGAELAAFNPATFYTHEAEGYTTYPAL